ncbi:MAG: DUF4918 family protein [Bacteroidales bacterium]|jgi:hypothetical protein|nr:DUF4918 family protein [Bacteroidales bacterium]
MKTLADRIIEFNRKVEFRGRLPVGISIMNPFRGGDENSFGISSAFYRKYYDDNNPRRLILGINPGRFGAGFTGIPFTDTKRLTGECGIAYAGRQTHEPSSVFIYEVIRAYGGPERFYGDYYINSVCPLGFTHKGENGREKNYNYYDRADLTAAVTDFIVWNIREQIAMGVRTDVCFCLGTGKNEKFLRALNDRYGFFGEIVALEHPRFIMQYKSASRDEYVSKYLALLSKE